MTQHTLDGHAGQWAAFRLDDGRPRAHAVFPRRETAVKACGHDRDRTCYLEVQADGMSPEAAEACLGFQRALHDAGFRLPDPEFAFDLSRPQHSWDRYKTIRHLATGGRAFAQ